LLVGISRVDESARIALVPGLWLEAIADAEWTVLPSAPEDAAEILQSTLDLVMSVFPDLLREAGHRREQEEHDRLAIRRQMEQRMVAGAVEATCRGAGEVPRTGPAGGIVRAVNQPPKNLTVAAS
jgi:hypothetical protein